MTKYCRIAYLHYLRSDMLIEIDQDEVEAVSILDTEQDFVPIYRPLTRKEKLGIIRVSLRYGSSGILYRIFKAFTLWITKDLYPKQGSPNSPRPKLSTMLQSSRRVRRH